MCKIFILIYIFCVSKLRVLFGYIAWRDIDNSMLVFMLAHNPTSFREQLFVNNRIPMTNLMYRFRLVTLFWRPHFSMFMSNYLSFNIDNRFNIDYVMSWTLWAYTTCPTFKSLLYCANCHFLSVLLVAVNDPLWPIAQLKV